jgi:8-oxo-dGTP pyrophosphatase MutT (NUDIX family)
VTVSTNTAKFSRPPLLDLSQADIVERLRRPPPPPDPTDLHVAAVMEGMRVIDAAVLVPLVVRGGQLNLLLTQRTTHLSAHAGQISFPGGRIETADSSREETALRETEEEIGLARERVTLLGRLPEYSIPSGFRITPVVGWIEPPFDTRPDPFEVEDIFEVPLMHFLSESNFQRREYDFDGRHRHYVAVPWQGRYIWGATAGMLLVMCRMFADPALK